MDPDGVHSSVGTAYEEKAAHEEKRVPLKLAQPFTPFPLPYAAHNFSAVKWYWFPGSFDLDMRGFLNIAIAITAILTVALPIILSGNSDAGPALSIAFAVITTVLVAIRANIALNQIYRIALCHSFYKCVEAKKIWQSRLESEEIYAKDVYHTETNITGKIIVLRDGTIELRSTDECANQTEAVGNAMNQPETISSSIPKNAV